MLIPGISGAATIATLPVDERDRTKRTNGHVTSGVPLAESANITSTSGLGIFDGETELDAQFRVLSRYHDTPDGTGAIRMVLVDFQDTITAGGTNTYTLRDTGSGTVSGANLASDETTYYEINTGAITVQISKTSGQIFEDVDIDKTAIVSSPSTDKWVVVSDSTAYYSKPDSAEIEENGPLRCVVKVSGHFEDISENTLSPPQAADGENPDTPLRYTIRYFAYKDKGYLKLQATLRNENKGWPESSKGDYVHNAWITESYLQTTVNGLGGSKTVAFDGYRDTTTADSYELLQDETSGMKAKPYIWEYEIKENSVSVDTGTQYDGGADMRDSSIGLFVANRWFWQNHPQGITLDASAETVTYHLWPDMGDDHRILGGIHKTHELLYYFHDADTKFTDELAFLKKRLVLKPSDTYLAETDFFWGMAPETIITGYTFPQGEKLDKAITRFANYSQALWDDSFITRAKCYSILGLRDLKNIRLGAYTPPVYGTWYGWLEFGGMVRGGYEMYHNQHYDWGYFGLLNWLRYNNWVAYDAAQEMLMHKQGILVLHDPDATIDEGYDYRLHGGHRGETDALLSFIGLPARSGLFYRQPEGASHFWTKDLNMQYLLTGEEMYREKVLMGLTHITRVYLTDRFLNTETRNRYRGIDALVTGYQLTGDTAYLDIAWDIFNDHLLPLEDADCPDRYVAKPPLPCVNDEQGFIQDHNQFSGPGFSWDVGVGGNAWMVEPFLKLLFELRGAGETAKAAVLEAHLERWAAWVKDYVMTLEPAQGTYGGKGKTYTPYIAKNYINLVTNEYVSNHYDASYLEPYADLLAWRYVDGGSDDYLNAARYIFKDSIVYGARGEQPIRYGDGDIGTFQGGFSNTGWFKIPKKYTKPMYYLRTEWINGK